jgi:hypothetical protein
VPEIAVHEAARLTEPELAMLAWFTLRVILLAGDHQQLRLLIFSRPKENPFQSQLFNSKRSVRNRSQSLSKPRSKSEPPFEEDEEESDDPDAAVWGEVATTIRKEVEDDLDNL